MVVAVCAYLLVAEDDRGQAEVLRRYLSAAGHETAVVHDGRAVLDEVRRRGPDLLVLDLMLPGLDGLTICRVLRAESAVPILMLTARAAEEDMLTGLDVGADDYPTKPYRPRELLARTRALLRRGSTRTQEAVLIVGEIVVDVSRRRVRVGAGGYAPRV